MDALSVAHGIWTSKAWIDECFSKWLSISTISRACCYNIFSIQYGVRKGEASQRGRCATACGIQHACAMSLQNFPTQYGQNMTHEFSVIALLAGNFFMALPRDSCQYLLVPGTLQAHTGDACLYHDGRPFDSPSDVHSGKMRRVWRIIQQAVPPTENVHFTTSLHHRARQARGKALNIANQDYPGWVWTQSRTQAVAHRIWDLKQRADKNKEYGSHVNREHCRDV
jgi:hypothetical protein